MYRWAMSSALSRLCGPNSRVSWAGPKKRVRRVEIIMGVGRSVVKARHRLSWGEGMRTMRGI